MYIDSPSTEVLSQTGTIKRAKVFVRVELRTLQMLYAAALASLPKRSSASTSTLIAAALRRTASPIASLQLMQEVAQMN